MSAPTRLVSDQPILDATGLPRYNVGPYSMDDARRNINNSFV